MQKSLENHLKNFNALLEIGRVSDWIPGFVRGAGADGVVCGISGGVDSALVTAIAARSPLGASNVLGAIMPCMSDPKDEEDARAVMEWLGIDYAVVNLDAVFDRMVAQLGILTSSTKTPDRLTLANIKARLRMTALYAFANERNYLNMGTGNKSELMIGYITKYGDGGVDFEPMGEYLKCEVYAMARAIGVPQQVLDRAPSAGLWEGQTDEDEIGLSYDALDAVLFDWGRLQPDEDNFKRVSELFSKSEHKRRMPPAFPRHS